MSTDDIFRRSRGSGGNGGDSGGGSRSPPLLPDPPTSDNLHPAHARPTPVRRMEPANDDEIFGSFEENRRGGQHHDDNDDDDDDDDDHHASSGYDHRILALSPTDASGMTAATGATGFATLATASSVGNIHVTARDGWDAYEEQTARRRATPPSTSRKKRSAIARLSGKKKDKNQAAAASASTAAQSTDNRRQRSIQTTDSIPFVQIRSLDVGERLAFERKPLPTLDQSQQNLDKKVSPSPQHVEVLERLYGREKGRRKARQLCWSPAISPHADPWGGWDDEDTDDDDEGENDEGGRNSDDVSAASGTNYITGDSERNRRKRRLLARKRRMLSRKRSSQFSRYTPIDPLDYVRSTLPAHAPVLTNTRLRLPVRSDVGFPGATDEEIRAKHMEIMRETEIEEHSPRIALLIGSGDLRVGSTSDTVENLSAGARACMEECEGLPDVPLAGRELVEARIKWAKSFRSSSDLARSKAQSKHKGGNHSNASDISLSVDSVVATKQSASHEEFRRFPGPDSTSTFAPPVGSTYSSTHLWRPTPFADQPPGMAHILSIPTAVSFSIGNIEPLVCSLAMYCLPPPPSERRRPSRAWSYRGKICEDFVFPAGEWPQILQKDALEKLAAQFKGVDKSLGEKQQWHRRTSKAIFSYNPLALPPSCGRGSLHIVLQVQKVTQAEATSMYVADNSAVDEVSISPKALERKRSMSGKIKKKLVGRAKKTKVEQGVSVMGTEETISNNTSRTMPPTSHTMDDIAAATSSAKLAFEAHGTEFLTPMCFGVLPLFPKGMEGSNADEAITWPNGSCQTMRLFTSPDISETHEEFIERLARMAESHGDADGISADIDDNESESAMSGASKLEDSSKKTFDGIYPVAGHAIIFNSIVGVDIAQVLLQNPELPLHHQESKDISSEDSGLPRLLADVSGDCAIMMSPEKSSLKVRKRSDLVRLPPSKSPSGYADLCEVREVLYLPPRPERLYDNDVPTYSNRLLNLLYLYPRQLRLGDNENTDGIASSYTVRISLVRLQSSKSGDVYTPTDSMYNPVPFGKPTLRAIYTKIAHGTIAQSSGDILDGIPMQDEVKVRLPDVLDGTYFLKFSLYSLETEDDVTGVPVPWLVNETFIPLSSSSAKEPISKERVVTIIPNGVHRIKLGNFQLLLESRLVSSIHSSDPGVSMILRDFKYGQAESSDKFLSTICRVMKRASGQAVVTHFQTLIYLHMHNLLNNASPELPFKESRQFFSDAEKGVSTKRLSSPSKDMVFLMNTIRSLLAVMSKSKSQFCGEQSRHIRHWNTPLMKKFQKEFVDVFDETLFSSRIFGMSEVDESQLEAVESSNTQTDDKETMEQSIDSVLDALENTLIERTVNAAVITGYEQMKHAQRSKTVGTNRVDLHRRAKSEGLLRTAYGATKTDRMKAEAELQDAEGRLTELFDDDETVVTTATFVSRKSRSERRFESAPPVIRDATTIKEETPPRKSNDAQIAESMRQWGLADDEGGVNDEEGFSTPSRAAEDEQFDDFNSAPFSFAGEKAKSMAQRINTVAHVMLTPCMAPNLSSILARKAATSPPQRQMQASDKQPYIDLANREHLKALSSTKEVISRSTKTIRSPGSDVDENDVADVLQDHFKGVAAKSDAPKVKLRGSQTLYSSRLELCVKDSSDNMDSSDEGQPYLYECVLTLWLQASLDYYSSLPILHQRKKQNSTLLRNAQLSQETAMMFAKNMDILLPLCLKSFVMRCSTVATIKESIPSIILDSKHMQVLEPLVEIMAQSLISIALHDEGRDVDWDAKLVETLSTSDVVLDFIVGLLSVVHPAQVSILIFRYFRTLRSCENEEGDPTFIDEGEGEEDSSSSRSETNCKGISKFRRFIFSRQLRLRAAERLLTLPRFVAFNFPYRYDNDWATPGVASNTFSWVGQCSILMDGSGISPPCPYPDGYERLPHAHWLAELLANECFSICSESCESVVSEAIAQIKASRHEKTRKKSALRNRSGNTSLSRADLLRLQSNASHAITVAYELLVRRHALDERFQTRENRGRVAAMFLAPVFSNTIKAVPWLAKMESTHKIRSLWLLSFLHTIQEAPEALTREKLRSYSNSQQGYPRLHRFVRVLRLCSSTCQGFITKDAGEAEGRTWLVQESYNTICAVLIIVVDECASSLAWLPREQKKLAQAVYDVLLHVLAMPLSSVAHQRALGGASQALSKFGALLSFEVIGDRLQHWARICLTLMNAVSLSVRSIAVDVVISLLSGSFDEGGNMGEIALIFLTVLPEVVAREMALYSVAGHLASIKDVERSVWPLRRALADMEEANPQDDDRIDPQLTPFLSTLCRGCQAVIDGVLIELRLRGDRCTIVGTNIKVSTAYSPKLTSRKVGQGTSRGETDNGLASFAFDADEESIYEAASSFLPETGPMQRLRWLLALKLLHEEKGQWVEAAESLMLCATTVADAIPHARNVWRPSRFALWHDDNRSLWLSTVGEEKGLPDRGNTQVMEFADAFLEPPDITGRAKKNLTTGMLERPSLLMLCVILCGVAQDAIENYLKEEGMESHAYQRFEQLLKVVMAVTEDHSGAAVSRRSARGGISMEENAALRKVSAALNGHMTRLAERMLLLAENGGPDDTALEAPSSLHSPKLSDSQGRQFYVRIELMGRKTARFCESTSLPTFLEWESPSICRVPKHVLTRAGSATPFLLNEALDGSASIEKGLNGSAEQRLCLAFAEPLLLALSHEIPLKNIVFSTVRPREEDVSNEVVGENTYVVVSIGYGTVASLLTGKGGGVEQTKRFLFKHRATAIENSPGQVGSSPGSFVEYTVAREFPCALSRQRTLLASEFIPAPELVQQS